VKQESKRKNADEALSHGDESLRAARVLIEAELFRESIPKLYYTMFHSIRALLLPKGWNRKVMAA